MQMIEPEVVDAIWSKVGSMEEEQAMGLINTMSEKQPELLTYIMSAPEEFSDTEAEQMLYIGVVLWQIIEHSAKKLSMISEEMIIDLEEKNITLMEKLDGESEGDGIAVVEDLLANYPQPHVLASISEALVLDEDEDEDQSEEDSISEEARGTMMLILKTALDSLLKAAA